MFLNIPFGKLKMGSLLACTNKKQKEWRAGGALSPVYQCFIVANFSDKNNTHGNEPATKPQPPPASYWGWVGGSPHPHTTKKNRGGGVLRLVVRVVAAAAPSAPEPLGE